MKMSVTLANLQKSNTRNKTRKSSMSIFSGTRLGVTKRVCSVRLSFKCSTCTSSCTSGAFTSQIRPLIHKTNSSSPTPSPRAAHSCSRSGTADSRHTRTTAWKTLDRAPVCLTTIAIICVSSARAKTCRRFVSNRTEPSCCASPRNRATHQSVQIFTRSPGSWSGFCMCFVYERVRDVRRYSGTYFGSFGERC